MILDNPKMAFRHIVKDKVYSLLSVFSLTIGITIAAVILYYVVYELSYDKFQKIYTRIYNIYQNDIGKDDYTANTQLVLAASLQNKFPEIEKIAQVCSISWTNVSLKINKDFIPVKNCYYSDPGIFDILSLNFIKGNTKSFSSNINSVLISKSSALEYFSNSENIIGKMIELSIGSDTYSLEISGIFEDAPGNSHFQPGFILPMQLFRNNNKDNMNDWGFNNPVTYILLNENTSKNIVEKKINSLLNNMPRRFVKNEYHLLPLADFHLNASNIMGLIGEKGAVKKIYIYSAIALLLLLIACINYINLNTARSTNRIKEIGIYKIMGAARSNLIIKLLMESALVSLLALPLIISAIELIIPYADIYFNRNLHVNLITNWYYLLILIVIVLTVGIISGIYSSIIISKLSPLEVLKSQSKIKSSRSYIRKILISFQFIIFSGMIICSYIIYNQMEYIRNIDLGYKKDNVLVLDLPTGSNTDKFETLKEELKNNSNIKDISIASSVPPYLGSTLSSLGMVDNKAITYRFMSCDENYQNTLGMEMKEGRFFNISDVNTGGNRIILNETAQKYFDVKNALKNGLNLFGQRFEIVGVIKDFHNNSLYEPVSPLLMYPTKLYLSIIAVKLSSNNLTAGINAVKSEWQKFYPDVPFTFKFIDDEFDKTYRADQQFGSLIGFFTIVAAFLAVIGLAGLTSFTTSRRVKEIGIRKVLGATVREILFLLTKEVTVISIVGCAISAPAAYYFMHKWLANFAYKTSLTIWVFVVSFLITLFIAFAAVGFQAVKAAIANPVNSLRNE